MAIRALFEDERFLEVSTSMALRALEFRMLSQQRILGLRMVKFLAHGSGGNLLPSARVVAGLASLGKATFMWIAVTIRALGKGQSDEPGLVIGPGCMALLAGDLRVHPGERIASFPVVELADVLPVGRVVALLASDSKPSLMLILVTTDAVSPKA
jgi:hypothetical protein